MGKEDRESTGEEGVRGAGCGVGDEGTSKGGRAFSLFLSFFWLVQYLTACVVFFQFSLPRKPRMLLRRRHYQTFTHQMWKTPRWLEHIIVKRFCSSESNV